MAPFGLFGPNVKKLKAKRDIKSLINLLADESHKTRMRAADALVELGAPAVPLLLVAMASDDKNVRILSTYALCDILPRLADVSLQSSAVAPLVARLKDQSPVVRQNASLALSNVFVRLEDDSLRSSAVTAFVDGLQDEYEPVRTNAARALDEIGWQAPRNEVGVTYWIAKGDWDKCIELGTLAVEPLSATIKHSSEHHVREMAVKALHNIGGEYVVKPLITALKDEHVDVRFSAIKALGQLGDSQAVEPLIDMLNDEDLCRAAATSLGQLGDSRAIKPLIVALRHKDRIMRWVVAEVLGALGGTEVVKPLVAALGDEDNVVREAATKALKQLGVDFLVDALSADIQDVRVAAAEALDKLGWQPEDTEAESAYRVAKELKELAHTVRYRGGLGEPYCSEECYARAAQYPLLQIETGGVCGICGNAVFTSVRSGKNYGVVPYEGGILVVCQNCALRARERFRTYNKCCMCQKSISV
jgi:HEAT repeat protein